MRWLSFLSLTLLTLSACKKDNNAPANYRAAMQEFVIDLSNYADAQRSGFIVIPQNGQELLTETSEGNLTSQYIAAIDGQGREDLYYGYNNEDQLTPADETEYMQMDLDAGLAAGLRVLVTDYCSTPAKMDNSYNWNEANGYISFAADHRALDNIPNYPSEPRNVNTADISTLADAQNFLYVINPEGFGNKAAFLNALQTTNYDVIIMDAFFDGQEYTIADISNLQTKLNGGSRLVISYMSIGEAEDYRYYWQNDWGKGEPEWLDKENPNWEGNYKVKYWMEDWQAIIFGSNGAYLDKVLAAGFDGVYLDIIDAFEYYE